MALLACFIFVAVILTWVMFSTRQSMLGFPSAIFWALTGGQGYVLYADTGDIIYLTFAFACVAGMSVFCMLGAYGLREKRDSLGDEAMERGSEKYFDEVRGRQRLNPWMKERKGDPDVFDDKGDKEEDEFDIAARPSRRRGTKSARKGEFDF